MLYIADKPPALSHEGLSGGDEGTRTPDLLHAKQALYQLSYIPTKSRINSRSGPKGPLLHLLEWFAYDDPGHVDVANGALVILNDKRDKAGTSD